MKKTKATSPFVRRHSTFNFDEDKKDTQAKPGVTVQTFKDAWRSTGIVCTLGPGSDNVEIMGKLMTAGLDVARFNFSHGSHEYHGKLMNRLRTAAKNQGRFVALALDTKGPEIRTGTFPEEEVKLVKDAKVVLTPDDAYQHKGTAEKFWVTYKEISKSLKPGMTVFIDDGLLALTVEEVKGGDVHCKVKEGGVVSNRKGVNLPGAVVTLPALSEKDINDIKFGVEMKVDMIFASFIRKAEDVLSIKKLIPKTVMVISKIENQEGCDNFEDILRESDGIMVARGDLGIEIDATKVRAEDIQSMHSREVGISGEGRTKKRLLNAYTAHVSAAVFVQQKRMIRLCRAAGKPVIVATQMLQSMVSNPRPTRAEVSDVANAVLDGADCVMLSGETAKGMYPVQAVVQMSQTCKVAEANLSLPPIVTESMTSRETIVAAGCKIAKNTPRIPKTPKARKRRIHIPHPRCYLIRPLHGKNGQLNEETKDEGKDANAGTENGDEEGAQGNGSDQGKEEIMLEYTNLCPRLKKRRKRLTLDGRQEEEKPTTLSFKETSSIHGAWKRFCIYTTVFPREKLEHKHEIKDLWTDLKKPFSNQPRHLLYATKKTAGGRRKRMKILQLARKVLAIVATDQSCKAILVLTNTGTTARYRPSCPVMAVIGSTNTHVAKHLQVTFGIHVILYEEGDEKPSANIRIKAAIESQMDSLLEEGDLIVCLYSASHSGCISISR
eukprot:jgi/Bigna1/90946/estExt_fgenesh1_pg.C_830072